MRKLMLAALLLLPAIGHAGDSKHLKWRAPRGNAGKRPPQGPEWQGFNGRPSAEQLAVMRMPQHAIPVPLSGLHPAPASPRVPMKMTEIASALERLGVSPTIASRAATHALLGFPSAASSSDRDDLLLVRKDVVMSYSSSRKSPNWVSWRTRADDLGHAKRSDDMWRADPSLPASARFISFHDYEHAGFDPGHMLPSADRTANDRLNERTYITSNTVMQSFNNNRGPWNKLESYTRDRVKADALEAHVIAGPIFGAKPLTVGDDVPVPNATWKIVVFLKAGQSLADVNETTRVLSVIVPNSDELVSEGSSFDQFLSTPAEIEKQTGLRFFSSLPEGLANVLRQKRDVGTRFNQ